MRRRINPRTIAALALAPVLGIGLATPALAGPVSLPRTAVTDPSGDVLNDDDKAVDAPYADIVSADGKKVGDTVELRYTAAKSLSPLSDPNWTSDETYTDFLLDTNGDGKEDFNVEYGVADGALYAEVTKADDQEDPPVLCTGTAAFTGNAHVVTVPLSCVGSPTRSGYRVETSYDLNVNDENSQSGYDAAPATGFANVT